MLRAAKYAALKPFFVVWVLKHMSFALPVERISETSTLLAFYHPKPAYPIHILLVPRKPIASLIELDPTADFDFLRDVYITVKILVRQLNLGENGYRLIINGGKYQDFPYLHFHLVADQPLSSQPG